MGIKGSRQIRNVLRARQCQWTQLLYMATTISTQHSAPPNDRLCATKRDITRKRTARQGACVFAAKVFRDCGRVYLFTVAACSSLCQTAFGRLLQLAEATQQSEAPALWPVCGMKAGGVSATLAGRTYFNYVPASCSESHTGPA